jgi:5,10-methylenetetrahydromethanopterin reductase
MGNRLPFGRFGVGVTNCRPAHHVLAAASDAEDIGAEILFCAEDVNCRDAFALLAAGATATTRIRLGTGVVNPYMRNPTSLAMAAATLDEMSGGRALLGLGTSSPDLITTQMGIERGSPHRVMREATAVVRGLLAGEVVTAAGTRFVYQNARLAVLPVQPRVPIFFAAMGPRMLRLAGEIADGVLLNVGASPEYIRWAIARIHEGATEAGRDIADVTIAAWLSVYIGDEKDALMRRAAAWLATMLSIPGQGELLLAHGGFDTAILSELRREVRAYPHAGNAEAAGRHISSEMVEEMTLVGSLDHVRRRLTVYREAGVQLPVLSIAAARALAT